MSLSRPEQWRTLQSAAQSVLMVPSRMDSKPKSKCLGQVGLMKYDRSCGDAISCGAINPSTMITPRNKNVR